jgi:hypothetical protein
MRRGRVSFGVQVGIPGRENRHPGRVQSKTRNKIGTPPAAKPAPVTPTMMESYQ